MFSWLSHIIKIVIQYKSNIYAIAYANILNKCIRQILDIYAKKMRFRYNFA